MNSEIQEALRRLPAVDELVRAVCASSTEQAPRWALVQAARQEIARLRERLKAGQTRTVEVDPAVVWRRVRTLLRPSLRPLYNATGVVLHTNLGRAPLAEAVLRRMAEVARGYSNLEYVVEDRRRGSRHVHPAEVICQLTGAEDAVVVNNNAAAVLLSLSALASGREVVVSRGELVEIGGSFRLPDVMTAAGAILREVGTTNRTHPADYREAIGEQTALLLKVHRSNFAVVGFTREVEPEEMTAMARECGLPSMFDLGSGCLVDPSRLGLPGETTVQQAVSWGFDLVSFSGDKLVGGPQAGIIVGRKEWIHKLRTHPLMRALRPDKMTLAGLVATLEAYRDGVAQEAIPALRLLSADVSRLEARACRLRDLLRQELGKAWTLSLVEVESRVGAGALPLAAPHSFAVAVEHPERSADAIEASLRGAEVPVIGRIEADRLVLDVRPLFDADLAQVATVSGAALGAADS